MQTFNHAGKHRFIVSDRVFWAAVVLAAAALLGRNIGQAAPPIPDELKAHSLMIVDGQGRPAISMGASGAGSAIVTIGDGGKNGRIKIAAEPDHGATILFDDKDKPTRIITAYAKKDLSLSKPPVGK